MPCQLDKWRTPTVLLFLYGLFKESRPYEPYITVYLTTYKNFTSDEIMEIIYPTGTYMTMALTVIIFLITDALLYRPIIIVQAISIVSLIILLIVGKDILAMVIVEIAYGLMIACDVAYFTYLYATVSYDKYVKVSALCRIAHLLGRTSSGLIGQTMISTELLNYLQLHYLSLAFGILAFIVAILLPRPTHSLYFHREVDKTKSEGAEQRKENKCFIVLSHIKNDLRAAYTQPYILIWTFWWITATCTYMQVLSYAQVLWLDQTSEAADQKHNGFVEVGYTLLGSGAAWLAARFAWQKQWKLWLTLSAVCFFHALCLGASAYFHHIAVLYSLYIAFGAVYFGAITVASSEVAQHISNDSSALIFGVNTFFSLVLQSILTAVITAKGGLALSSQVQFYIYAAIYAVSAVVFVALAITTLLKGTPIPRPGATMQSTDAPALPT